MIKCMRLTAVLALFVSALTASLSVAAYHVTGDEYHTIQRDEFERVWERTDLPVGDGQIARTWIWGPGGYSALIVEEYDQGDSGEREVQYFDKSRMEMPTLGVADPDDSDSPWLITQGLLARELMLGEVQLGDDRLEQHYPSQRSAAGDPGDVTAPTYEILGQQMAREPRSGGEVIVEHLDRTGNITTDQARFGGHNVTDVHDAFTPVDGIDKNIASVFWDFMTGRNLIYQDGDYQQDQPLFVNPFYAVGYPLTDAYWADVTVNGVLQDVLIQCFERRCLTYAPGNPEGWQVESGNVGQHYYQWRYHEIPVVSEYDGTFSFNGEPRATMAVGETIVLTVQITHNGEDVEGIEVTFSLPEGQERFATLEPLQTLTGPDGIARIAVTGQEAGTTTSRAKFTIDRSPPESPPVRVDVDLGSVDLTIVEADDPH